MSDCARTSQFPVRVSAKPGLWTLDWTVDWTLDCILDCILDRILDLTSYAWPRRHVGGRYISVSVDAYGNLSGDDVE